MYLARYYFERQKWIPAVNRFKLVVESFDDTIFIEEALHRLVEIHYMLGLEDEAKKYAYLLGYNYQSGGGIIKHIKSLIKTTKEYKKIKKDKIKKL